MEDCVRLNASLGNSPFIGVIHLGSHEGQECRSYFETGTIKKVIWVEGNKTVMKDLYDKTRGYSLKQQYFNEIIGDTDGEKLTFYITNDSQCSSIFPLGTVKIHHPQVSVVETKEVLTTRFDTICKKNNIDLIGYDFVNIDLQGSELKALRGMGDFLKSEHGIKMIYCEVNKEHLYEDCCLVEELDEFLASFGFKRMMTKWVPDKFWGDGIFIRKV